MEAVAEIAPVSKRNYWIGYAVGLLPSLLVVMSGMIKFIKPPGAEEGMAHLGWPLEKANLLGIIEITCVVLYLIPRTSVLGAVLMTGYMGGAVATHVRVDDPWIMALMVGVLFWVGLWIRERSVRALIPIVKD